MFLFSTLVIQAFTKYPLSPTILVQAGDLIRVPERNF